MREARRPSAGLPAGGLVGCLLEADPVALFQARRRRHRALLISLGLEAALVAALVLVPLFTTVARPGSVVYMPLPPYRGSQQPHTRGTTQTHPSHRSAPDRKGSQVYAPVRIPEKILPAEEANAGETEPPDVGLGPGWGPPGPPGSVPPFGSEEPRWTAPPVSPPPSAPPRPLRRSEGVQEALLIHRVVPVYPPPARQSRVEGTVRLHAIIGRDGRIESLEVLSGHPLLVQAALAAVRQWRYQPTLLSGVPVEVETYISVVFQLQ